MKGRREARRIALDVLYESDIRAQLPSDTWDGYEAHGSLHPDRDEGGEGDARVISPDSLAYAESLIRGVQEHQADIDALIVRYADHWTINRMPVIDKTLVRIALFEILWGDDVPIAVAINEAVEVAKSLSTEDSGRFINGLLGRIVENSEARKTPDA